MYFSPVMVFKSEGIGNEKLQIMATGIYSLNQYFLRPGYVILIFYALSRI